MSARREIIHRPELSIPLTAPSHRIAEEEIKTQEPNAAEMAINASKAALRFMASGFALSTDEQAAQRREICLHCEYWLPTGNLGLGKCRKAGCGCTVLKWKSAAEKCPDGRWPEINS